MSLWTRCGTESKKNLEILKWHVERVEEELARKLNGGLIRLLQESNSKGRAITDLVVLVVRAAAGGEREQEVELWARGGPFEEDEDLVAERRREDTEAAEGSDGGSTHGGSTVNTEQLAYGLVGMDFRGRRQDSAEGRNELGKTI